VSASLDLDLSDALGRGVSREAFERAVAACGDVGAWVRAEVAAGRLRQGAMPAEELEAVEAWHAAAPAARNVVLAGMGGSALGARVLAGLSPGGADGPRLHVVDTVDPRVVGGLLRTLDPAATRVLGISKSGGTLETTAVFLVFERWLQQARGAQAAAQIAVVCGEDPNPLRERARRRDYACFAVPAGVGGRFSALTPVGLVPAACLGVDLRAVRAGALAARATWEAAGPEVNPALALAALHHAAAAGGRSVAVLWPYGETLRPLGPWWAQLVGESLGKPGVDGPAGVTPLAATGPADQHSLLQLLVQGPDDKLTVLVQAPGEDGPAVPADEGGLCAAAGRSLGAILSAEAAATRTALAEAGRPVAVVHLPAAEAAPVGAFLMTWFLGVVLWARLLGVDPYGQPGVEGGKRAARALLAAPADDRS
jgi:glucose-6-phosphate isomerase